MYPIVIAHHLIWTAYGWWLPNDPRGSTSRGVSSASIASLGAHHFGRKKVQPTSKELRLFYAKAQDVLKHPLLKICGEAAEIVADAFANVIAKEEYTAYACAIMPDHIHLLIRKHKYQAEEMIEHFKYESRTQLIDAGIRPINHPVWSGGGGWMVFLTHPDDVERTIVYINNNPAGVNLPEQRLPFVTPYDRWPLHEGHSPNSPYARRLRALGRYP